MLRIRLHLRGILAVISVGCFRWHCEIELARCALIYDLVAVFDDLRADTDLFNDAVRAALFRAPVGVMLNGMQAEQPLQPHRVLIG